MQTEPRPRLADGRFLVPLILALLGALFGLCALPFEASPSKVVLSVIAVLLIAGAGAALAVAVENAKRADGSDGRRG